MGMLLPRRQPALGKHRTRRTRRGASTGGDGSEMGLMRVRAAKAGADGHYRQTLYDSPPRGVASGRAVGQAS